MGDVDPRTLFTIPAANLMQIPYRFCNASLFLHEDLSHLAGVDNLCWKLVPVIVEDEPEVKEEPPDHSYAGVGTSPKTKKSGERLVTQDSREQQNVNNQNNILEPDSASVSEVLDIDCVEIPEAEPSSNVTDDSIVISEPGITKTEEVPMSIDDSMENEPTRGESGSSREVESSKKTGANKEPHSTASATTCSVDGNFFPVIGEVTFPGSEGMSRVKLVNTTEKKGKSLAKSRRSTGKANNSRRQNRSKATPKSRGSEINEETMEAVTDKNQPVYSIPRSKAATRTSKRVRKLEKSSMTDKVTTSEVTEGQPANVSAVDGDSGSSSSDVTKLKNASSEESHTKMHSCSECGKGFAKEKTLQNHLKRHQEENRYLKKKFCCDICGMECTGRKGLKEHKITHANEKHYTCDLCKKSFTKRQYLVRHHKLIHVETVLNCDICKKVFKNRNYLAKHMIRHKNERPHLCPVCGKGFAKKPTLTHHLVLHNIGERHGPCEVCGKTFIAKFKLDHHMRTAHISDKPPYICGVCGKEFKEMNNLYLHRKIHTEERPHSCSTCKKSFKFKGQLKSHMLVHSDYKPYKCDICGKAFKRERVLNGHKMLHSGERPHLCELCGKGFIKKIYLKFHMMEHNGEKPHKCNVCGKEFVLKGNLKSHMMTHTGETPYICEVCGEGFKRESHLKLHMMDHGGDAPYTCVLCDEGFKSKNALQKHMSIHSEVRPYTCNVCGEGFADEENLASHMVNHEKLMYYCSVCGDSFNQESAASMHMKTHGEGSFIMLSADGDLNLSRQVQIYDYGGTNVIDVRHIEQWTDSSDNSSN